MVDNWELLQKIQRLNEEFKEALIVIIDVELKNQDKTH